MDDERKQRGERREEGGKMRESGKRAGGITAGEMPVCRTDGIHAASAEP